MSLCVGSCTVSQEGRGREPLVTILAAPQIWSTLYSLTYIRFGTVRNRRFNLIVPTLQCPNDCAAIGRFKGVFPLFRKCDRCRVTFAPDIHFSLAKPGRSLDDVMQIEAL